MSWSVPRPALIRNAVLGALLAFSPAIATGAAHAQDLVETVHLFAETASGFTLFGDIKTGALQAGRQLTYPTPLKRGQDYMVVGFCDDDCTDLDLVLLDLFGTELESDYLVDAQPVLIYTPDQTDQFEIRVDMVSCSIEPCSYAVAIFQGQLEDVLGMMGEDMEDRMAFFREDLILEGYAEMGTSERGGLNNDREEKFSLSLSEGMNYQLIGVCDNDCEDMDLVVYDPSGGEVDSDRLTDALPILDFTAAFSGEYRVAVDMVSCSLDPCAYEIATFIMGAGLAAGGMPASGRFVSEATYQGTLEAGDEKLREGEFYDEYTIYAQAGQQVIADLRSPDFDTYLIMESPGGDSERNDDFGDDTMHSHLEMVANEDGTFSILVTTFSAESIGDYTLHLAVVEGG
jgi:hypothetical protein